MGRPSVNSEIRFEAKYIPEPNSGCWIWLGAMVPGGYGWFWDGKKHRRVHRYSYEHYRGSIPVGLTIDHLCRVRCCVNPWHLESVTHRENVLRGNTVAAENAKKTHCRNGHELIQIKRQRTCPICSTESRKRWRATHASKNDLRD